jgi:hypothetical protein
MLAFLRQLHQRWANWCGDADMEREIRRHLSINGYFGGSAKLRCVRLAAVERPGWVQVYRFEATARVAEPDADRTSSRPIALMTAGDRFTGGDPSEPAVYHELFGLVREDHRRDQTAVRVFASDQQRRELFDRWSDGLVQLRGGRALMGS